MSLTLAVEASEGPPQPPGRLVCHGCNHHCQSTGALGVTRTALSMPSLCIVIHPYHCLAELIVLVVILPTTKLPSGNLSVPSVAILAIALRSSHARVSFLCLLGKLKLQLVKRGP